MRFRQYKFKFYLNARHGIYKNGVMGEIHPHTWEIVINVVKGRDETVKFHHLEHRVEEFLSAYQDKTLNDVPPFDMINPTLENICEYFKEELTKILNRNGWIFLMMEISESPSMSYVVSLIDDSYTEEMQTMVYTELSGVSALHSVTESDEVARLLQLDSQDTASRGMSTLPAIMEDTLATPRFARYHQAMESADRLITEAMSADKNFELQLLQIQQQLDVTLTS